MAIQLDTARRRHPHDAFLSTFGTQGSSHTGSTFVGQPSMPTRATTGALTAFTKKETPIVRSCSSWRFFFRPVRMPSPYWGKNKLINHSCRPSAHSITSRALYNGCERSWVGLILIGFGKSGRTIILSRTVV